MSTPIRVVDASALAALVFGEPSAEEIARRLEGSELVAPALLAFELANVGVTKVRRYPEQREAILDAHRLATRMAITEVEVDLPKVVQLADESGLTAYDAAYLWIARTLNAELVTLDDRLNRAAATR